MSVKGKVGHFASATATGNQSVTGIGFQPKAVIFWTQYEPDATIGTWNTDIRFSMGFASGSAAGEQRAIGYGSDSGASSNTARSQISGVVSVINGTPTQLLKATLVSLDSDGFTINWGTVQATAYRIHYMALGGSNLSAKVVEWAMPGTGGGNKAITGAGFQPQAAFMLGTNTTAAVDTSGAAGVFVLGGFDGGGGDFALGMNSQDAQASSNSMSRWRNGPITSLSTSTGTEGYYGTLVSFDSDGCTINVTENTPPTADDRVFFLFLRGVGLKAGKFAKSTGAAPASQAITGLGFKPVAVQLYSLNTASMTDGTLVNSARLSVGATDGTAEEATFLSEEDNQATMDLDSVAVSDKCIVINGANDAVADAVADISSMDSGGFTLSWSTNNATAHDIWYLAIGSAAPVFTSGPTLSYPTAEAYVAPTRTPFTISFTATDSDDTGANELTYDVRTASGGGGSSIGSGTFTSGVGQAPTFAYSSVAVGTTTLYVRITDGNGNAVESSVNVTRRDVGPQIMPPQTNALRALMARTYD